MGVGVGEAVLNPVAVSLIGDLFVRERRATPTSVFFSAQTLGGSLSFLLVATIVAVWSGNQLGASPELAAVAPWRVALFLIGVPGLLLALLMALGFREPERGRMDRAPGDTSDRKSTRLNSSHYCAYRMPSSACKKKKQ